MNGIKIDRNFFDLVATKKFLVSLYELQNAWHNFLGNSNPPVRTIARDRRI